MVLMLLVTFDDKGDQNCYISMVIITIQLLLARVLNVSKFAHISSKTKGGI